MFLKDFLHCCRATYTLFQKKMYSISSKYSAKNSEAREEKRLLISGEEIIKHARRPSTKMLNVDSKKKI